MTPCSICEADVAVTNDCFPFCSARCRTIDLGGWLGERYRAFGESDDAEQGNEDGIG